MRVITGKARGRKLKEPQGDAIRPTTDMVKESTFNIIQFSIEGRRVLDLFAGTGQMGIETLSRGARACVFVDESKAAEALIRENLKHSGLEGGKVLRSTAADYVATCDKFDLIFIDPPYESGHLDQIIRKIEQFDILNENGIIVAESRSEKAMPEVTLPYEKGREYRYGKVKLTIYTRHVDADGLL